MGILRSIPNMTVVMPADYASARKLVRAAAEFDGPVYLRFTRDAVPVIYDENEEFELGKAKLLREGRDVAILANGDTLCLALRAAEQLAAEGTTPRYGKTCSRRPVIFSPNAQKRPAIGAVTRWRRRRPISWPALPTTACRSPISTTSRRQPSLRPFPTGKAA